MLFRLLYRIAIGLTFATTGLAAPSVIYLEENFPPYSYLEQEKPSGYCVALMTELKQRLGWTTPIELVPWQRAERAARSDASVLVASMVRNNEREKHFLWLARLFGQSIEIYRLRNSTSPKVTSYDELKNYRIGTLQGSASLSALRTHGFPEAQIEAVNSFQLNINKLRANRIDYMTMSPPVLRYIVGSKLVVESEFDSVLTLVPTRSFYLVANPAFPEPYQQAIERVMAELNKDGTIEKLSGQYGID